MGEQERKLTARPDFDELGALLDELRASGIEVGIEQHLLAQDLLSRFPLDDMGAERVATVLSPVVAGCREEQERVHRHVRAWVRRRTEGEPPEEIAAAERIREVEEIGRHGRIWPWALVGAGLLALGLLASQRSDPPETVVVENVENQTNQPDSEPSTESDPVGEVLPGTAPELQPLAPARLPKAPFPETVSGRVVSRSGAPLRGAQVELETWRFGEESIDLSTIELFGGVAFSNDLSVWAMAHDSGTLVHDLQARTSATLPEIDLDSTLGVASHPPLIAIPAGSSVLLVDADGSSSETSRVALRTANDVAIDRAALNFDGSRCAGLSDNSLFIWSPPGEAPIADFALEATASTIQFSRDGRSLVVAGPEHTWVWRSGQPDRLAGFPGSCLAEEEDTGLAANLVGEFGDRVLTCDSFTHEIRVVDVATGRVLAQMSEHRDEIQVASFSSDGRFVVSADLEGRLVAWDVDDGSTRTTFQDVEQYMFSFGSEGDQVAISSDETGYLWDLTEGGTPHPITLPTGDFGPLALFFLDDGTLISLTISADGNLFAFAEIETVRSDEISTADGGFSFDIPAESLSATVSVKRSLYKATPPFSVPVTRSGSASGPALDIEMYRPPPQSLDRFSIFLKPFLVLSPLIAALCWWGWRLRRRRLVLERRRSRDDPDELPIPLAEPRTGLFRGPDFDRVRRAAFRRDESPGTRLDAPGTVDETLRAGLYFTPVYGVRKSLTGYLVLIDRVSLQDQQTRMIDTFLDRLKEGGVHIDRYYYQVDPRRCSPKKETAARVPLQTLAARHPGHRLLIFGDGAGLVHTTTQRVESWAQILDTWKARLLLTFEQPASWGLREERLAASGMVVLPAQAESLQQFVEALGSAETESHESPRWEAPFPRLIEDRPRRWLAPQPPPEEDEAELLRQLRTYLGLSAYRWLCSLAVYPELHWQLTLHLGTQLRRVDGSPALDEVELTRLTRLPWLRQGRMPDWLRLALITSLPEEDELEIRRVLQEMLGRQELGSEDGELQIARPREVTWRRYFADWFSSVEEPQSPMRDRVFIDFVVGRPASKLQLEAPRWWERLLYRNGRRSLGLRVTTGLLLAMLSSTAGWAAGDWFKGWLVEQRAKESKPAELWTDTSPRVQQADLDTRFAIGRNLDAVRQGEPMASIMDLLDKPTLTKIEFCGPNHVLTRSEGEQVLLWSPDSAQSISDAGIVGGFMLPDFTEGNPVACHGNNAIGLIEVPRNGAPDELRALGVFDGSQEPSRIVGSQVSATDIRAKFTLVASQDADQPVTAMLAGNRLRVFSGIRVLDDAGAFRVFSAPANLDQAGTWSGLSGSRHSNAIGVVSTDALNDAVALIASGVVPDQEHATYGSGSMADLMVIAPARTIVNAWALSTFQHAGPIDAYAIGREAPSRPDRRATRHPVATVSGGTLRFWGANASGPEPDLEVAGFPNVAKIEYGAETDRVLLVEASGSAVLVSTENGSIVNRFEQAGTVDTWDLSPDGNWVASSGTDSRASGSARLWSAIDGRPRAWIEPGGEEIAFVRFSPDSRRLLLAGRNGEVSLWSLYDAAPATIEDPENTTGEPTDQTATDQDSAAGVNREDAADEATGRAENDPAQQQQVPDRQPATQQPPFRRLTFLGVSINDYSDGLPSLATGRTSIGDLSRALERGWSGLFSNYRSETLVGRQATMGSILKAFQQQQKESTPDDVTVVYLGALGGYDRSSSEPSLIPYEGSRSEVRLSDLGLGEIQGRVLVLLDLVVQDEGGSLSYPPPFRAGDAIVFSEVGSPGSSDPSAGQRRLLLEGTTNAILRGDRNGDGILEALELQRFLEDYVPSASQESVNILVSPRSYVDFPLGRTAADDLPNAAPPSGSRN
ncbi:hypothetical protein ABI59_12900 [Acidobacteria bacterium Mor1]|nr:hypothetical protein ABI59_12900 [Acidobacteria bacterium Mor1]